GWGGGGRGGGRRGGSRRRGGGRGGRGAGGAGGGGRGGGGGGGGRRRIAHVSASTTPSGRKRSSRSRTASRARRPGNRSWCASPPPSTSRGSARRGSPWGRKARSCSIRTRPPALQKP